MIIGFAGQIGCGKDTIANKLVELGFSKLSFAGYMKEVLSMLFDNFDIDKLHDQDYKEEKLINPYLLNQPLLDVLSSAFNVDLELKDDLVVIPTRRKLLQVVGTDYIRASDVDAHINATIGNSKPFINYVISDVRFTNELEACDYVFYLERATSNVNGTHEAENSIDKNDCIVIDNNYTIDNTINQILKHIGG